MCMDVYGCVCEYVHTYVYVCVYRIDLRMRVYTHILHACVCTPHVSVSANLRIISPVWIINEWIYAVWEVNSYRVVIM